MRARTAKPSRHDHVRGSLASALNALYDLAEALKRLGGYSNRELDDLADGDAAGETTMALVFARGGKTHDMIDFGDLYGYGTHAFGEGPFGGGRAWQKYEDQRYRRRSNWYALRVQGQAVAAPLEVALKWLSKRPEIVEAISAE